MRRDSAGFTLIEVLIAMTILTASVVTAMLAFQNNMRNSAKAAEVTHLLTQVEVLRSAIEFDLQHTDRRQQELFSQGVRATWKAEQVAYEAPAKYFSDAELDFREYGPRYRLYAVTLTMEFGTSRREFNYEELVWDERLSAPSP
ncbi:type II secretion system protein [Pseudidiomarina sp. CB1]|uniref:type II secretion system protein n=1 Tax=Pseudidiomarina sp. CB1 TaxID=2972484 RepID=UPI002162D39A|nr:prepilin-type N-terminal cleavage/methylation domain-containing protein [Pseudidiomarina sp. CB1]